MITNHKQAYSEHVIQTPNVSSINICPPRKGLIKQAQNTEQYLAVKVMTKTIVFFL